MLTLSCAQALPASAKMQLVYGKGVTSPSGIPNETERRFDFTVRAPFAASFSCERENAKAPCTPLRPLTLSFNAALNFDLADAKLSAPANIASIIQKIEGDTSAVELTLIGDVDIHSFREDKKYNVDVAFQPTEKPAALLPAASAPPVAAAPATAAAAAAAPAPAAPAPACPWARWRR